MWRLHRIWSTDWFRNEERELRRAVTAIEQAKASQPIDGPTDHPVRREIQRSDNDEETGELVISPYALAQPRGDTLGWHDLHNVPVSYLRDPIIEIVRVEGPVHVDAVARRIADAAGISRIGARIRANLERVIKSVVGHKGNGIARKGEFLWPSDMNRPVVRDWSVVPQSRKIELIPPEEIAEAVKMIVDRSYGIDKADAAPGGRTNPGIQARVQGHQSKDRFHY